MSRELPNSPPPHVLNAVASQAATEYGYLLPPSGVEVYRLTPEQNVDRTPAWEAAAVHHLLTQGHLTRGEPTFAYVNGTRRRLYTVGGR
jgi:hypothetical protein